MLLNLCGKVRWGGKQVRYALTMLDRPIALGALVAWLVSCSISCNALVAVDGDFEDQKDAGAGEDSATQDSAPKDGTTPIDTGNEICHNGVDDDGDTLADCADPKCKAAGFTCVPDAPSGWLGPYNWKVGSATVPPSCSAPWSLEQISGGQSLTTPSGGNCPACACNSPIKIQCGFLATVHQTTNCSDKSVGTTDFETYGNCVNTGMQNLKPKAVKITSGLQVLTGSCQPTSSGKPSFPDSVFDKPSKLCGTTTAAQGCSAKNCLPPAGRYCIAREGTHACPATGFSEKHTIFKGTDDQRTCSACSCGKPTSKCTGGQVELADPNGGCGAPKQKLTKNACLALNLHPTYETLSFTSLPADVSDASCTPVQSKITGTVKSSDPVTVCCLLTP